MKESEDEFEYQETKLKATPKIYFPIKDLQPVQNITTGPPPFMQEFIVPPLKLQPVKTKLDSIIIKGSKILSRKAKSSFVEGALYLMAKSYFYKNEWLPSQIKCSELIDKFPNGELSPDAHLLFAENLLIQKKFYSGKLLLSRTIDIAWQKERYDILSEAFRLRADLALYENDLEGAVKPYKQAIAQSDNNQIRARWQLELASIYYRLGLWEDALINFRKVRKFSPDYLTLYSSLYYESLSNIRLGRYEEGERILEMLKTDGKYQEWKEYTHSGFMLSALLKGDSSAFRRLEVQADSAFRASPPLMAVYYEKGLKDYYSGKYFEARKYFARARNIRTPVYASADKMYNLLNNWEQKNKFAEPLLSRFWNNEEIGDTSRIFLASLLYELGANFERLGFIDSTEHYFRLASIVAPVNDTNSARYLYSYSRVVRDKNLFLSDSLKDLIVERYPTTEFGREVLKELGYTSNYIVDSTKELLMSGLRLVRNKEYGFGISQLRTLFSNYPEHPLAPRSLYVIGYVFERKLYDYDSAYLYYKLLLERYPESIYAQDINLAVAYYSAVKSGGPIPDSLKERTIPPRIPGAPLKGLEVVPQNQKPVKPDTEKETKSEGLNPLEYFKDPSKILKDVKEIFSPENLTPSIDLPKNPLDEFKPKPDSSKIELPTQPDAEPEKLKK